MGLFDKLSNAGDALSDVAKKAAHETVVFAGGANRVIGVPAAGTVRGAVHGNIPDIAKVGIAAASVIPAERGLRGLGRIGQESETIARSRSLIADATQAAQWRGTAEALAPHMQLAGRFQRLSQAPTGVGMRARSMIAGGERGSLDIGKVTQFPDSMSNVVRRVKARVMGAINMQGQAGLAEKIAQTKDEIVKLGGTPPTGPFTGASPAKLNAVKSEIGSIEAGEQVASDIRSRAKQTAMRIVKGGEGGAMRVGRRIPSESDILKAHANVPAGQMLTTVADKGDFVRMTKGSLGKLDDDAVNLVKRAGSDVRSGRSRVAGFYEKLKGESGFMRLPGEKGSPEYKAAIKARERSGFMEEQARKAQASDEDLKLDVKNLKQIASDVGTPKTLNPEYHAAKREIAARSVMKAKGMTPRTSDWKTTGDFESGGTKLTAGELKVSSHLSSKEHPSVSSLVHNTIAGRSSIFTALTQHNKMVPMPKKHPSRLAQN